MKEVRIDLLEELAKHLDNMEPNKFSLGSVKKISNNGEVTCCAIGELPNLFPELGIEYFVVNQNSFGTTYNVQLNLIK